MPSDELFISPAVLFGYNPLNQLGETWGLALRQNADTKTLTSSPNTRNEQKEDEPAVKRDWQSIGYFEVDGHAVGRT